MISGYFAGMIGGALGLGGAIVLVPVWLNSGINSIKATSSSSPLIFFSALISFTICLLSDRYNSFTSLGFYFALAYLGSALVKCNISIIFSFGLIHSGEVSPKNYYLYLIVNNYGIIVGNSLTLPDV